jgi:hypothetical protein
MTAPRRTGKSPRRKPAPFGKLPLSVTTRDGKTTTHHFAHRRIIRMGELRGKTVAYVELFTSQRDSHSLSIRFTDKTRLALVIVPGFTVKAEHYKLQGLNDPKVLKRWPDIKCE